ncbi:MAG: response regulator, partial [Gemmatimonadaceae bacterium]
VVVRVMPAPRGDDWLRVSVRDTGVGIPQEKLEPIFEPFRQVDATTTRRYGGTGLGLSISRRLVQLMGGTLSVTSVEGQGSEFWFDLSLPAAPGVASVAPLRADLNGVRVLVVDDNPTNRHVMQRVLQRAGCEVDTAEHGREGLTHLQAAAARRVPYRLLVTDLFMPEMDGFELVTAVRAEPALRDVAIVMLSSAIRRGDAERGRMLAVSTLLLKPAGRTELVDEASRALGLMRAAPRRTGEQHVITASGRRALRILLAEDNLVNQEVAATMLRRRGHHVDVVENGREAVDAVGRAPYDLVLMDLQMPEMDGFQATAEIRKLPGGPTVPVVAITANAMVGERERCLAAGMDGYISKPYKPHELFAAVESTVAGAGGRANVDDSSSATMASVSGNPVDLDAFRGEMKAAGVESAVDGILEVFVNDAPSKLAQLDLAVAAADAGGIARAAHAYKSSAGTIHADGLAELLRETELAAQTGDAGVAMARLPDIRRAHQDVLRQLQAARGGAAPRD